MTLPSPAAIPMPRLECPSLLLSTLPTEILYEIYSYMNTTYDKVIWPLICKRFYQIFPVPQFDSWPDPREPTLVDLDKNCGISIRTHAICYGQFCHGIRKREFFHPRELENYPFRRDPGSRACYECAKSLWISPEKQLCYGDLRKVRYRNMRWYQRLPPISEEDKGVVVLESHFSYAVRCRYDIMTVPERARVSRSDMELVLHGFDIFACPHMQLNDPRVIESYDPCAPTVRGHVLYDMHDRPYHTSCKFPTCRTEIYWLTRPTDAPSGEIDDLSGRIASPRKTIYLHVHRHIGDLEVYDNPLLLSQLIIPNVRRLTKFWKDRVKRKEKIVPLVALKYEEKSRIDSSGAGFSSLPSPDMPSDLYADTPANNLEEPLFYPFCSGF
jgi:hypothetical protein